MKVLVTFLAAPWPAGTVPGHVVEFPGSSVVPAWAVGKCELAADDAEAVSVWEPAAPVVAQSSPLVVNPASAVTVAQTVQVPGDDTPQAEVEMAVRKGKGKT
jgi:hypothetical protein